MRKWSWLLGVVMLLALGTGAVAQEEEEYRDVAEVLVYGGVSIPGQGVNNFLDTLGAKTGWDVGVSAGLFLTPSLVLGLDFTYAQYGIDTDNDMITLKHRFYNPMLYLKYYFFSESNLVPYVKGTAGLYLPKFTTQITNDDGTNRRLRELSYGPALAVGASAGVMLYIHDYGGLFLEGSYQYAKTDKSDKTLGALTYEFGETTGLLNIHFGVATYFGTD